MTPETKNNILSKLTEPIKLDKVQQWHEHFVKNCEQGGTNLKFPYTIKISKEFIDAIREIKEIDGMELIFIAYDKDVTSPSMNISFKANEVNLVLAPLVNGTANEELLFDYSDPCRPPCARMNQFKKIPR